MHNKKNVAALLLVGVIGVVLVAVAVFSSLQALSDNKDSTTQELDGVVIEKLGGERFRIEHMCGKKLYFASLSPSGGFAPNVNVFMDKWPSGLLPSLSEYVHKAFKDYEAMGCNVSIVERDYNYVTMSASGNGLTFDIKIIRDVSKGRFVVVTGTMRTETVIMGARKSDKEAESIVHKIVHCVHSARL